MVQAQQQRADETGAVFLGRPSFALGSWVHMLCSLKRLGEPAATALWPRRSLAGPRHKCSAGKGPGLHMSRKRCPCWLLSCLPAAFPQHPGSSTAWSLLMFHLNTSLAYQARENVCL